MLLLAAGKLACCAVRSKPGVTRLLCARKVVREVFCWSRNPTEVRHLAQRKEELYRALLGEHSPPVAPGVKLLLETLTKHQARLFTTCCWALAWQGFLARQQEAGQVCLSEKAQRLVRQVRVSVLHNAVRGLKLLDVRRT